MNWQKVLYLCVGALAGLLVDAVEKRKLQDLIDDRVEQLIDMHGEGF